VFKSSLIDQPLQPIRSGIELVVEIYHRQQRNVEELSALYEAYTSRCASASAVRLLKYEIDQVGACFGVNGMRIQMVRPCGSVWLNFMECSEP